MFYLAFPLCHVAAYNVLVQHLHGCTVVLTRRFDPVDAAALIDRHRVTVASLAPTMIATLLDHLESPSGRERSERGWESPSGRGSRLAMSIRNGNSRR